MLGIALLRQKEFHPFGRYLEIVALPDCRVAEIEETLMRAVLDEAGDRALQVSFEESDRSAAYLYDRFGFVEMRRTYRPKLRLEQVILPPEEPAGSGEREAEIRSFAELAGNGEALDSLAELMRFAYAASHEANPPADFPVSVWRTFAQADDLLNEGSFAAFAAEGNEALAFACLHESENEQEAELGWLGARSGCDALMQSVDRKRMEYVLAGGFVQLTAEIDDTDPYQRPLLEKYRFETSRPLLTYRREADDVSKKAEPKKEGRT
ncbi:hypothetical protein CDO73_23205 [Saccharibacillus sp. O23]|nr:hypothetical protein CDO73_23205 [Saccharibacillus sp. O23]